MHSVDNTAILFAHKLVQLCCSSRKLFGGKACPGLHARASKEDGSTPIKIRKHGTRSYNLTTSSSVGIISNAQPQVARKGGTLKTPDQCFTTGPRSTFLAWVVAPGSDTEHNSWLLLRRNFKNCRRSPQSLLKQTPFTNSDPEHILHLPLHPGHQRLPGNHQELQRSPLQRLLQQHPLALTKMTLDPWESLPLLHLACTKSSTTRLERPRQTCSSESSSTTV